MSCFWTALCAKVPGLRKHSPSTVIEALKSVNCMTRDVQWDGAPLHPKELEAGFEWVRAYDPSNYGNGHETSIADPFLLLIAQIFRLRLTLAYTGPVFADGKKTGEVVTTHTFCHTDARAEDEIKFHTTLGHFA
jgi:hypothetical protein